MKRLLAILVASCLALHLSGCSSEEQSGEPDANVAADDTAAATDGGGDQAAATEAAPGDEVKADDAALDKDPALDEVAKADDLDKSSTNPDDPLAEISKNDNKDQPPAGDQPPVAAAEPPPAEPAQDAQQTPPPEMAPTPEPQVADAAPMVSAPKPSAPLQKIKDVPFSAGGKLLNTVYLARPGDTLKSVAQKVLPPDANPKELVKYNKMLSRGVKTGDKIYYNSSLHPDRSEKVLTYYEDKDIPPQTYVSVPGDTMKSVAANLLGSKDTWKELWATNEVQEKGSLPEGTTLRYWVGDEAAPPPPPMPIAKTEPPKQETLPPPPPPAPPVAVAPPPPAPPDSAPNAMGQASTTPPPGRGIKPKPVQDDGLFGLGGDNMIYLIGGGAALIGIGLMLAIKKKKDASRFAAEGQTQI